MAQSANMFVNASAFTHLQNRPRPVKAPLTRQRQPCVDKPERHQVTTVDRMKRAEKATEDDPSYATISSSGGGWSNEITTARKKKTVVTRTAVSNEQPTQASQPTQAPDKLPSERRLDMKSDWRPLTTPDTSDNNDERVAA